MDTKICSLEVLLLMEVWKQHSSDAYPLIWSSKQPFEAGAVNLLFQKRKLKKRRVKSLSPTVSWCHHQYWRAACPPEPWLLLLRHVSSPSWKPGLFPSLLLVCMMFFFSLLFFVPLIEAFHKETFREE